MAPISKFPASPPRSAVSPVAARLGAAASVGVAALIGIAGCAADAMTGTDSAAVVNPRLPGALAIPFESVTALELSGGNWVLDEGSVRFAVEKEALFHFKIESDAPVDDDGVCTRPTHFRLFGPTSEVPLVSMGPGHLEGRDADRFVRLEQPGTCNIAVVVKEPAADDADPTPALGLRERGVHKLVFWPAAPLDPTGGIQELSMLEEDLDPVTVSLSLACDQERCEPMREACADDLGDRGQDLMSRLSAQDDHGPEWNLTQAKSTWGETLFFDTFEYDGAPMEMLDLARTVQTMLAGTEMPRELGSWDDAADARFDIFPLPDPKDDWKMPTTPTHWQLYRNVEALKFDGGLGNEWLKFQNGLSSPNQWDDALKAFARDAAINSWRGDYSWYLREQDPATKQYLRAIWLMHYHNGAGGNRVVVLSQCGDAAIENGVGGCGRLFRPGDAVAYCDDRYPSEIADDDDLEGYLTQAAIEGLAQPAPDPHLEGPAHGPIPE